MNAPQYNTFTVKTRDVDGQNSRKYKTLDAARKRFEAMLGYSVEAAMAEQYHNCDPVPAFTDPEVRFVRGVSNYGTVVTLFKEERYQ